MRIVTHDQLTLDELLTGLYRYLCKIMPKEKRIALAHYILKMDENINGSE